LKANGYRGNRTRGFSIENVYERYHPQVLRFFLGKGLQHDAAEDLSQEVFYRVLRSGKPLVGEDYTRNLVFCVAQNLLIDHFRKNNGSVQERTGSEDDVAAADGLSLSCDLSPEDVIISSETSEDVKQVLSGLPPRHAQAIMLREMEGLSYREMASRLGMSEKAAESLLHRARVQLKSGLAEAGERRGGWWSTIPVALSSMARVTGRKAASIPRWVAARAAALSAGVSSLAIGHSAMMLLLVLLLVGSAVGVGVAASATHPGAAVSPGEQKRAQTISEAGPGAPGAIAADALKVSQKPVSEPQQAQTAVENQGPQDALAQTGNITRGLLSDVGGILDLLTSRLGDVLNEVTDPLFRVLGSLGLPQGLLDQAQQVTGLALANDIQGALVDTGIQATYVLEDAVRGVAPGVTAQPAASAAPATAGPASTGSQQAASNSPGQQQTANPTASTSTDTQKPSNSPHTQPSTTTTTTNKTTPTNPTTSPDGGVVDTVIDFVNGIL